MKNSLFSLVVTSTLQIIIATILLISHEQVAFAATATAYCNWNNQCNVSCSITGQSAECWSLKCAKCECAAINMGVKIRTSKECAPTGGGGGDDGGGPGDPNPE